MPNDGMRKVGSSSMNFIEIIHSRRNLYVLLCMLLYVKSYCSEKEKQQNFIFYFVENNKNKKLKKNIFRFVC